METVYFDREFNRHGELSNFYWHDQPLIYEDKPYPTAEHLYQAHKYMYSDAARAYAEEIRQASTPHKAKLLGERSRARRYAWQRRQQPIIEAHRVKPVRHWEANKRSVMAAVLRCKFTQDAHCRKALRGTGCAPLVAHLRDRYWGDGLGDERGGDNHLGHLLETLRAQLPSEKSLLRLPE